MRNAWIVVAALCGACGADPARPVANAPAATTPTPVAPTACYCFSWVHRDENGEQCYATEAACDAEFTGFGRHDKLPCRAESERCQSFACRGGGKECFRL